MKAGDFVKMYAYDLDDTPRNDNLVITLVERSGIILTDPQGTPPVLWVLWNDGVEEWIIASAVEIIPNRDIL